MEEQNNLTVEIDGLRDRDEAEELEDNLVDYGIRRDAISISD